MAEEVSKWGSERFKVVAADADETRQRETQLKRVVEATEASLVSKNREIEDLKEALEGMRRARDEAVLSGSASHVVQHYIPPSSLDAIYCNHPEPPQQQATSSNNGGEDSSALGEGHCMLVPFRYRTRVMTVRAGLGTL